MGSAPAKSTVGASGARASSITCSSNLAAILFVSHFNPTSKLATTQFDGIPLKPVLETKIMRP